MIGRESSRMSASINRLIGILRFIPRSYPGLTGLQCDQASRGRDFGRRRSMVRRSTARSSAPPLVYRVSTNQIDDFQSFVSGPCRSVRISSTQRWVRAGRGGLRRGGHGGHGGETYLVIRIEERGLVQTPHVGKQFACCFMSGKLSSGKFCSSVKNWTE